MWTTGKPRPRKEHTVNTTTAPDIAVDTLTDLDWPLPCDSIFVGAIPTPCDQIATRVAKCPNCAHEDLACDRCYQIDLMFNHGNGMTRCPNCTAAILPIYEPIDLR